MMVLGFLFVALVGGGPPPVSVFADLDGTWEGTFVGYDQRGGELYRIRVRQTYETLDATTQRLTLRDEMPDGTVITGEGTNTARRDEQGTLHLECVVRKSDGDLVRHRGRLVRGPDGDEQIVWSTRRPSRIETFREVVRREGDATIYEINGLGQYDGTLMLMHGRYRRIETGADES